jgi:hypothetical protein
MAAEHASTFLGLTAEGWTALSTFVLAALTCILVGVGIFQIRSIRAEAQRSRTLEMCDRYDCDPVLDLCLRRLSEARRTGELQKEPEAYRPDIATLLNYLDSLAVGIEQGLYIEELARDHVEPIVKRHVKQYFGRDAIQIDWLEAANYERLVKLENRWSTRPPRFQDRKWFKRRNNP